MTQLKQKLAAMFLLAFLGIGLLAPGIARAGEDGRRNTTLALGAVTGYLLSQKKWVPAAIAGVGTYAAYHNWQAEINARHRREHYLQYRHAYRLGYRRGASSRRHRR